MWPFSNKNRNEVSSVSKSVSEALQLLAEAGIRTRPGISNDDLLFSLGGTMESPVDWIQLFCVLGGEIERGKFERISDDIWHFDAECIEDHGDYVRVLERFVILTKGALPITNLRDHVDIEKETAWVEFTSEGKTVHWDLEVDNDWLDPELYSKLQEYVSFRVAGKKYFIVALGQDSLVCFGDESLKRTLFELSGLKFEWE